MGNKTMKQYEVLVYEKFDNCDIFNLRNSFYMVARGVDDLKDKIVHLSKTLQLDETKIVLKATDLYLVKSGESDYQGH